MQRIINQMKLHGSMAVGSSAKVRFGTVSSYDPDNYCCKVLIQPDEIETGWLPIASPLVGNQWGLFAPPSIGDMVDVHYQENDYQAGYVALRFYNDEDRPVRAESGVFYLIHKSGSFLKFENDGTVHLNAATGIESTAPVWNHTGPININGDVSIDGKETVTKDIISGSNIQAANNVADQGGTKTMAGMRVTFNNHTHTEHGDGGGTTSPPATGM
jgi:phage baseplate assembly protein V